MKPTKLSELFSPVHVYSSSDAMILGAAIDSRNVQPGDLFFALPGNRVHGEAFLEEAKLKGAHAAVVSEKYSGESFDLALIKVPDVLQALQKCAHEELKKRKSQVIAVTGSLGKTTTKGFLATLLSQRYMVFASPLSYNSQATVPLSIMKAKGDEDFLILEMGMTHPGQLLKLVEVAPPDFAILTTIAHQHVTHFKDGLQGISREKASIFSHPKTRLGLFHHDIEFFQEVVNVGNCRKKTFSTTSPTADYYLSISENFVKMRGYKKWDLKFDLRPCYQNFLAACCAAIECGINEEEIVTATKHLKTPAMRFEKIEKKGILFINDAYNANPDAMIAALQALPKKVSGKKIAVFSEMDALGSYAEEGHVKVAKEALHHVDHLLCIGNLCKKMYHIWQNENRLCDVFYSKKDLEEKLKALAIPGDVVLLKGSRSSALEEILKAFD